MHTKLPHESGVDNAAQFSNASSIIGLVMVYIFYAQCKRTAHSKRMIVIERGTHKCEKERNPNINSIKSIKIKQNRHQMQNISMYSDMIVEEEELRISDVAMLYLAKALKKCS